MDKFQFKLMYAVLNNKENCLSLDTIHNYIDILTTMDYYYMDFKYTNNKTRLVSILLNNKIKIDSEKIKRFRTLLKQQKWIISN